MAKAKDAVRALERSSFPSDQVSLAARNVAAETSADEPLQSGDEMEQDAATGAGVGGLVGVLLAAPLLTIPGVGPALVAGPLAGGLTGAIVGGIVGAMSGWGVHEDHVRQYEQQIRDGKVLVIANGNPADVADAQQVLRNAHPHDIELHAPTSADSPEVDDT